MKKANHQTIYLAILLGLAWCLSAYAQNGVRLGEPEFVGNGCNRGTASASVSPDGQTLSVLFDNYIAEAGGDLRRPHDRKACNILIPVEVPAGYSVAVLKVDYRGFVSLPAGADAKFNVDYFFGGRVGPRLTTNFRGPYDSDFITNNNLSAQHVEWSPCGREIRIRAHSAMIINTNRQREQSLAAVDSADLQAGFNFNLQWKRCEERPDRPGRPDRPEPPRPPRR